VAIPIKVADPPLMVAIPTGCVVNNKVGPFNSKFVGVS
jgi:hypothetical protein